MDYGSGVNVYFAWDSRCPGDKILVRARSMSEALAHARDKIEAEFLCISKISDSRVIGMYLSECGGRIKIIDVPSRASDSDEQEGTTEKEADVSDERYCPYCNVPLVLVEDGPIVVFKCPVCGVEF